MALSVPPVEKLVRIVRQYYPAGLDTYEHEQEYLSSTEIRALKQCRQAAADQRGQAWSGLTHVLETRYGRERVFDWTHLRADSCFHVRVYTASSTPDDAVAAVLLVSVLAPIHVTFTVFERRDEGSEGFRFEVFTGPRPETEALTRELDLEASERMQSARIDWKILETPVPEISTAHRELGNATLADLLFSDTRR